MEKVQKGGGGVRAKIKKVYISNVDFFDFGPDPPPFWTFSTNYGIFYFEPSPNWYYRLINPLKPDVWERLVLPGGGAQRHPLEINEGVSGEQDSLNTIFNTHKIRIVCKI